MTGLFTPTLPLVLDALTALWKGWPAFEGVDVDNGPTLEDSPALEVLAVGWSGPDKAGEADAIGRFLPEGLGPSRDRERYVVHNLLAVCDGGRDFAVATPRAASLWAEAYRAVYADHTLGGLVMRAAGTDWNLLRELTDRGAVVKIAFDLDIDSYTRP